MKVKKEVEIVLQCKKQIIEKVKSRKTYKKNNEMPIDIFRVYYRQKIAKTLKDQILQAAWGTLRRPRKLIKDV